MKSVGGNCAVTGWRRYRTRRQQENCQLITSRAAVGRRKRIEFRAPPRCPTRPYRITATIVLPFPSVRNTRTWIIDKLYSLGRLIGPYEKRERINTTESDTNTMLRYARGGTRNYVKRSRSRRNASFYELTQQTRRESVVLSVFPFVCSTTPYRRMRRRTKRKTANS